MRVVFLGSPEVAVIPLQWLHKNQKNLEFELVGVVSQPPRPVGRGRKLDDPPVARFAKEHGLRLLQPERARDPEFLDTLRQLAPDVAITAAYGQILSDEFLSIPRRATINIHPSKLPKYRGASPVQSALFHGDQATGVTILFTVRKLDAGAIICQKTETIQPHERAQELMPRLFASGAEMLAEALLLLRNSEFRGMQQNPDEVSHCQKFVKADGEIDWYQTAEHLYNRYRAFTPWPGVFSKFGERRIKFTFSGWTAGSAATRPGIATYDKARRVLVIGTGDGCIEASRVQVEGKKEVDATAFWNGLAGQDPVVLGT